MDEKQSHCLSFFDLWCILVLLPLCGELRCGYLSCASELSTNQHSTYAYCHGHQAAKCVVAFLENSRDSLNGLKSLSLRGHRATQTQTRDRGLTPQALQFFELLLTDHPSVLSPTDFSSTEKSTARSFILHPSWYTHCPIYPKRFGS